MIIVDDGSSDDSVKLIRAWLADTGFSAEFVEHGTNRGIPAALNSALTCAHGDYLTVICDDLWAPDRLKVVIDCFETLPRSVGVLFGDAELIDSNGKPISGDLSPARTLKLLSVPGYESMVPAIGASKIVTGQQIRVALYHRCFIPAPSTTVRMDVYDIIGAYDESFAIEDLDFYFRAAAVVDFAYLRKPLVHYRLHSANFTSGRSDSYLQSLADVLDVHGQSESTRPDAQIRRHVREEALRVTNGLLEAGLYRLALRTVWTHYLRRLQPTLNCLKETVRLGLLVATTAAQALRPVRRLHLRSQRCPNR